MEEVKEDVQEVQETPEEEVEEEQSEETPLSPEEIADLKKRADASSQNYERMKKEKEARERIEQEKKALEAKLAASNADIYSDEDDGVKSQLAELTAKLTAMEEEKQMAEALLKYPAIKDKQEEFDEFREEYPGLSLSKVANLFVVEKDLFEKPKRKGLESGGTTRTVPKSGKMTAEDVKRLRENNNKEYLRLLKAGKIDISD